MEDDRGLLAGVLAGYTGTFAWLYALGAPSLPMPLRPVQLLWLNLVSDGAPALALGLEKGDADIMKQSARSPTEPVINRDMAVGIGVRVHGLGRGGHGQLAREELHERGERAEPRGRAGGRSSTAVAVA